MANRTHFLQCYVHLTDKTAYEAAKAQADLGGGWILGISPDQASIDYGGPLINPFPAGTVFNPPCITSGYFASSFNYPKNVAQFTKKSGGWFGIPLLFGDTHTYKWCFTFLYAGSDDNESEIPSEPTPVAMGQRRWVDGFEQGLSAATTGNAAEFYSPQASRHVGGYGWAARGYSSAQTITHRFNESGGVNVTSGWDRFYIRLRRYPNTAQDIWRTEGAISGSNGPRVGINPSGQIEAVNNHSSRDVIGTGATLPLNEWRKIDVLWRSGGTHFMKIYVNGALTASIPQGSQSAGISQVQDYSGTILMNGHTVSHRGGWDFDDWVASALPAGGSNPELFPSRDWNAGSKVVLIRAQAAAASNTGNFAGPGGANANDFRFTKQRPVLATLSQGISTNSASQRFACVTDADRRIDYDPLNRGANGISATAYSVRPALPADATIGVKLPGAAEVTATLNGEGQVAFTNPSGELMIAGGTLEPVSPMAGTELSYTCNSSAAGAHTLAALGAQVECIGVFHPEDYVRQADDPADFVTGMVHFPNAAAVQHVEDSPWGVYGQPPPAIVVIHCRTYVGNGTSQQLLFRTPPTWVFIRNTATHEHCWWYHGAPAASSGGTNAVRSTLISRVYIDPNFTEAADEQQTEQTILEVCGNNVASNLNGATYNLMAWCDPGMRFSETGGLAEHTTSDVARDTPLNSNDFVTEYAHYLRQETGNGTGTGLHSKGLGNNATEAMIQGAAAPATAVEFATGVVRTPSGSSLYSTGFTVQVTFLVMRRIDDAADPDPNIAKVMQLASWIGDGTASRTVTLGPASGRRPMWAMVMGSNGNTRVRDATHTGTNSLNAAAGSQVTDGITAGGIDSISVGTALNTNAVRFEAIVFPGCDAVAVNNGWGANCESIPVEPKQPKRPPIVPPIETPPTGPGPTPPGTTPLTPTGTITQCPTESTIVINMALSRIGISKQLTSTTLNTEVSPEATVARLHYDEDVRAILRDFPWPFATRYETLTQVAGPAFENDIVQAWVSTVAYPKNSVVRVSGIDYYALGNAAAGTPVTNTAAWSTTPIEEVNGDWLYAYRAPTLMAMARRVVNNTDKTRRMWDTTPPDFRVGSDAVGAIIYSNEPNAELEYTVLDNCVARQGDALFRNALAWRHAHALAPALTRDEKITASCWSQYERLLRDARTSAGQEKQDPRESDPDWITGRN